MREKPPPQLVALLERLGLATAGQVGRVGCRVRRLARDLPRFESVWVDALAQARILTPFQAAEINAGRGEALRIGPYVLCRRLTWPNYVNCYRARRPDTVEVVRLAVVDGAGGRGEEILGRLEDLAAASQKLGCEQLAPITRAESAGDRIWAASRWVEGRTAAEWMVHNGRFPPEVVLEIARAMLSGLATLEEAGICHGDLSTSGLMLTDTGGVVLLQPGVRAILRPEEGHAHAELLPEAYDYLAPERITQGTAPTIASDVYACGCVWWHLLCGRPPFGGGDSLAKLRAAQAAEVFDVRRLAPEAPSPLAAAVSACLDRVASCRPESMARLVAQLGLPTRCGRLALARCLARPVRPSARAGFSFRAVCRSRRMPLRVAAATVCVVAATGVLWPVWHAGPPIATHQRTAQEYEEQNAAEPRPSGLGYSGDCSDHLVTRASYEAERSPSETPPTILQDLVLATADGPLEIESLELHPEQCVRGMPDKRPLVMVPRGGLVVDVEDVRFEDIDFVWDHSADRQAAIVQLRAARAEFCGCSFRSSDTASGQPAAIRWTHPAERTDSVLSLPSGRLQLSDCVLGLVGTGVDCRPIGAVTVELSNTLHLGSGPLVRLDHCPKPDEPVLIVLSQVTTRGSGPLMKCRYQRIEDQPGEIAIRASRCAFIPGPDTALLVFVGPKSPGRLLRNMRWTGHGSLVPLEAIIAVWHDGGVRRQVLDDASFSIAGLVRSKVGFAGDAQSGPTASRIIRWQAPLQSADPPGIDPTALPGM